MLENFECLVEFLEQVHLHVVLLVILVLVLLLVLLWLPQKLPRLQSYQPQFVVGH